MPLGFPFIMLLLTDSLRHLDNIEESARCLWQFTMDLMLYCFISGPFPLDEPKIVGTTDAARQGIGGVFFDEDGAPCVWRAPFLLQTRR